MNVNSFLFHFSGKIFWQQTIMNTKKRYIGKLQWVGVCPKLTPSKTLVLGTHAQLICCSQWNGSYMYFFLLTNKSLCSNRGPADSSYHSLLGSVLMFHQRERQRGREGEGEGDPGYFSQKLVSGLKSDTYIIICELIWLKHEQVAVRSD